MEKMFEYATKNKFRFPYKGMITTEDLFDLSVTALDQIYKTLNGQVKKANEESLLDTRTTEDKELTVKIEIIKYIVNIKLEEKDAREKAAEKRVKNQKIMSILARKEDEALENMSAEELQKLLEE